MRNTQNRPPLALSGRFCRRFLALWAALAAACSGPKFFVNFPGSGSSAAPAPAAPAAGGTPTVSPGDGGAAPGSAAEPAAPGGQGPAAAATVAPAPVAAAPAPPAEPPPPYWFLYASWWSDHQDLLRKLDAPTFPLPSLEGMFRSSQESLSNLGQRLDAPAREELSGFLERYDKLRKDALRDGNRGILRQALDLLGKQIAKRFSKEQPPAAAPAAAPPPASPG